MKVLILAVTYKSYDILQSFTSSIDKAAIKADAEVTVAIGDNTEAVWQEICLVADKAKVRVFPYHQNLGYLPCALRMLEEMRGEKDFDYDFVAVSNVDLSMEEDFLLNLGKVNVQGIGWIAPDIFTPSRSSHENPFMLNRPTAKDFTKWRILYYSPFLYGLYEKYTYSHGTSSSGKGVRKDIYAGHGSFMLFTREFLLHYTHLESPVFMYAEEFFFAELMKRARLRVSYEPSLCINNVGSVSISLFGMKWKCKQNWKSLKIVRDMFF